MRSSVRHILLIALCGLLTACSMTKNITEDDPLFIGLKPIVYADEKKDSFVSHRTTMKEEVEAALATVPNGALFGSSYHSVPWSWHLWVYNTFQGRKGHFAEWMAKKFGKPPVLMSQVNPALRAAVAQSILKNYGYFNGNVSYRPVTRHNLKKARLEYTVTLDSLWTIDSMEYVGFPKEMLQLIDSTSKEQVIKHGSPFSVSALESERSRISTLMRNNGYYYYSPSYTSYLADTTDAANKARLRMQLAEGLDDEVMHKWYIGKVDVNLRRSFREQLTDSTKRRLFTLHHAGIKPPIVPGVIARNLRLRRGMPYSYDRHVESSGKINSTGVFSSTDFQFTPRENDTLDLRLNCVIDKPYDLYFEANAIGKTIGRYGPEVKVGFTKRNVFKGAEKLDVNLHGNYEWQSADDDMNSYQYGVDASLEFPRIIAPFIRNTPRPRQRLVTDSIQRPRRRRFYSAPTTYAKVSTDIVRRPQYYKMHIVSGEWTYRWQPSESSRHEFSPLTLKYQFMNSHTAKFDSVMVTNPYLQATMENYFVPKMRYSYVYSSPSARRHPVRWETTIEESGNLLSVAYMLGGHRFNEKEKELFKTPYSQFVRVETDFTKTWSIGLHSQLVGHVNGGMIYAYGNSHYTPFSETFYVGGANSVRAFAVRAIGPGEFYPMGDRQMSYLMQNGDIKLVGNLEFRTKLFGDLGGAVFLDAGNVWNWEGLLFETGSDDEDEKNIVDYLNNMFNNSTFQLSRLFKQTAIGTGLGLRYDLGFLVLRLDWGLAIHCPYNTGKRGSFNVNKFREAQALHFAIGYPF